MKRLQARIDQRPSQHGMGSSSAWEDFQEEMGFELRLRR